MALKNCPECGHEISKKAKACPKCGHAKKGFFYGCGTATVIILLLIIAIAVVGIR